MRTARDLEETNRRHDREANWLIAFGVLAAIVYIVMTVPSRVTAPEIYGPVPIGGYK